MALSKHTCTAFELLAAAFCALLVFPMANAARYVQLDIMAVSASYYLSITLHCITLALLVS